MADEKIKRYPKKLPKRMTPDNTVEATPEDFGKPKVNVLPEDHPLKEDLERIAQDVVDEEFGPDHITIPKDFEYIPDPKIYCQVCGEPNLTMDDLVEHMGTFHPKLKRAVETSQSIQDHDEKPTPPAVTSQIPPNTMIPDQRAKVHVEMGVAVISIEEFRELQDHAKSAQKWSMINFWPNVVLFVLEVTIIYLLVTS